MTSNPRAASSAILERDGRFLLVLRRNPPSADMYAFPGGRAEDGETPDQTALREFEEETGIRAFNPQLFATYDLKTHAADGSTSSHFFLSVFTVEADGECGGRGFRRCSRSRLVHRRGDPPSAGAPDRCLNVPSGSRGRQ